MFLYLVGPPFRVSRSLHLSLEREQAYTLKKNDAPRPLYHVIKSSYNNK